MKPKLFIGSSIESLNIAYALQENLEHDVEATVWSQGIFEVSRSTLNSLTNQLENFDFAAFILGPDDEIKIRGTEYLIPRDNIIFELGLFIGKLGQERSFLVTPSGLQDLHLPTDLLGVTPATFNPVRDDNNTVAALGGPSNRIRRAIQNLGVIKSHQRQKNGQSFFHTRLDTPLPTQIQSAKTLDMIGTTLISVAVTHQAIIRNLKANGTKIRLLISNPDDDCLNRVYAMRFLEVETPEQHATSTKTAITNFKTISGISTSGGSLEVRIIDKDIAYSYIGVDTNLPQGRISVEMYLTKIPLNENPLFKLSAESDPYWFNTFRAQFTKLWDSGTEIS